MNLLWRRDDKLGRQRRRVRFMVVLGRVGFQRGGAPVRMIALSPYRIVRYRSPQRLVAAHPLCVFLPSELHHESTLLLGQPEEFIVGRSLGRDAQQ